jgi:predicted DNA-binding transcriptional regulator AlpA
MRVEQASAYLSISRSAFLRLVGDGVMPPPVKIGGMTTWDRLDLDNAYDELKHGTGQPTENSVHKRLRELEDARRQKVRSG